VVYGANTDVGKTLLTAGLCRHSSLHLGLPTLYVKPVQAGVPYDEDTVRRYGCKSRLEARTLHRFDEYPCSPHLASELSGVFLSDGEVCGSVEEVVGDRNQGEETVTYVETAGGVLSPSTTGLGRGPEGEGFDGEDPPMRSDGERHYTTQARAYSSLGLPSILVGDSKLGGVSVTLCSLEALKSRGWRVDAVVFVGGNRKDPMMQNHETVEAYLKSRGDDLGTKVFSLPEPPPPTGDGDLLAYFDEGGGRKGLEDITAWLRRDRE